jgi:hypothetical protein
MTLSFSSVANFRQYLPGLYFIAVAAWMGFHSHNLWMLAVVVAFLMQLLFNNRYLNLILGTLTIIWSGYMAFEMFIELEPTILILSKAISFTILNLYMSRMLFLNQNFAISSLRENSLDEILFL